MRLRRKKELNDQAPKRRRRKPWLLAVLAGVGGWLVLKTRGSTPQADEQAEQGKDPEASKTSKASAPAERVYTSRARQTTTSGNAATQ